MNTGVENAIDLSWKLAATLAGWGDRNCSLPTKKSAARLDCECKASRAAMSGRLSWRAAYHPDIRKDTPEGAAIRAKWAAA